MEGEFKSPTFNLMLTVCSYANAVDPGVEILV